MIHRAYVARQGAAAQRRARHALRNGWATVMRLHDEPGRSGWYGEISRRCARVATRARRRCREPSPEATFGRPDMSPRDVEVSVVSVTAPSVLLVAEGLCSRSILFSIRLAGFPDSGVFREFGTLLHGFRRARRRRTSPQHAALRRSHHHALGHIFCRSWKPSDSPSAPSSTISSRSARRMGYDPNYLNMLRRHTIRDYDAANVGAIIAASGNRDVQHAPIGYVPQMHRIAPAAVQDIDVLFDGSITSRRRALSRRWRQRKSRRWWFPRLWRGARRADRALEGRTQPSRFETGGSRSSGSPICWRTVRLSSARRPRRPKSTLIWRRRARRAL